MGSQLTHKVYVSNLKKKYFINTTNYKRFLSSIYCNIKKEGLESRPPLSIIIYLNNADLHILMIILYLFLIEWMFGNKTGNSRKHLPFIHFNIGAEPYSEKIVLSCEAFFIIDIN